MSVLSNKLHIIIHLLVNRIVVLDAFFTKIKKKDYSLGAVYWWEAWGHGPFGHTLNQALHQIKPNHTK